MTVQTMPPEQMLDAPVDKLDSLIEVVTSMRRDLDVILFRLDDLADKEELAGPVELFGQSWREAQDGQILLLETLWEEPNAEYLCMK